MSESDSPLREGPVRGIDRNGRAVVVRLAGELDLYNVEQVRSALLELAPDRPETVILDLAEVEFVDSTVLGVLVEARSRFGDGVLRLAGPQLETRRALKITGLDRHLPVYDSVDQALTE